MYRFTSITAEEVATFRRRYLKDLSLACDAWDDRSTYHAIFQGDEIVSAARLTQRCVLGLPFMEYVNLERGVKIESIEIGRFLVKPSLRRTHVGWYLFKDLILTMQDLYPTCEYVYVDCIMQRDLKQRGLKRLGFFQTDALYFDPRYQAQSIVFEAPLLTLRSYIQDWRIVMIDKDVVIEELRKLAPNQPLRDCPAYVQWQEQEEARAESSAQKQIELAVEDARVRRDAGFIDKARDAYEQALEYATQLGEEALVSIIKDEMGALPF